MSHPFNILIKSYFCYQCDIINENHVKKTNTKLINFGKFSIHGTVYIFFKTNNSVYLKEEGLGSCWAHGGWVQPEPSNAWPDFLRTWTSLENLSLGLSLEENLQHLLFTVIWNYPNASLTSTYYFNDKLIQDGKTWVDQMFYPLVVKLNFP